MKSKEEIEKLAEKNFPIEEYPTCEGFEHFAYKQGYTQCQQHMADDLEAILNNSIYVDFISKKEIVKYLKSLNKQD
jgi:hypothetical protein